jgi:putative endonuclease
LPYYVYILASRRYGTLYIGVTRDLSRRIEQHRSGAVASFTRKYRVCRLVYFETFDDPASANAREKQLKKWNREWKIQLVEQRNPEWRDLVDLVV